MEVKCFNVRSDGGAIRQAISFYECNKLKYLKLTMNEKLDFVKIMGKISVFVKVTPFSSISERYYL